MDLQEHQLDPDDNTESKRPSFRPAVVPYQTLVSLCNELHRPDEGSSRFGKRFFKGNAIDPSIAPMISEDDENALPDKNGRSFSRSLRHAFGTARKGNLWKGIGGCIVSGLQADLLRVQQQCRFSSRQGPAGEIRFDTFFSRHSIGRPFESLLDCAALMYACVPETFHKLKVTLRVRLQLKPYWTHTTLADKGREAPLLKGINQRAYKLIML